MKKIFFLLFCTFFVGSVLTGCSQGSNPESSKPFDSKDIHFKVVNHTSLSGEEDYSIQIKNGEPMELTHLELYLSYPIKKENSESENPFKIKGQSSKIDVDLKKGESVQFTFSSPIKEVFGNSNLLDFKNPSIKLTGFSKDGNKEIPFGISGGLKVLAGNL